MSEWARCPRCGLNHTVRADGLCPRCRAGVGGRAPVAQAVVAGQADATGPFPVGPSPAAPAPAAPAPAAAWRAPPGASARAPRLGEVLSATFRAFGADAFWVTTLALLGNLVFYAWQGHFALSIGQGPARLVGERALQSLPVVLLAGYATMSLAAAAITISVSARLGGRTAALPEVFSGALRHFGSLFVSWVVITLAWAVTACTVVVPMILAASWAVSTPAIVLEGRGPVEGIKRSRWLTGGCRWVAFGLLALTFGAASVGEAVARPLGRLLGTAAGGPRLGLMTGLVATSLVSAVLTGLATVGMAVLYHALRDHREGAPAAALAKVFE